MNQNHFKNQETQQKKIQLDFDDDSFEAAKL